MCNSVVSSERYLLVVLSLAYSRSQPEANGLEEFGVFECSQCFWPKYFNAHSYNISSTVVKPNLI